MDVMAKRWHRYQYKNLTYVLVGIIFACILFKIEAFHLFLLHLGSWGYVGAFIGGILFVSTFTVATGSIVLLILAEKLSIIEMGLIAGLGGAIGDLIIFHFIRNKGLIDEIKHFFQYLGGDRISHLLQTKYFTWTLPVMGALIIASPLPDELGVSLMGISKMKTYQFIILSYMLDTLGIMLILSASTLIKP
jgi:hypothetical protein